MKAEKEALSLGPGGSPRLGQLFGTHNDEDAQSANCTSVWG